MSSRGLRNADEERWGRYTNRALTLMVSQTRDYSCTPFFDAGRLKIHAIKYPRRMLQITKKYKYYSQIVTVTANSTFSSFETS